MQHLEKNILSSYVSGNLPEQEVIHCHRHLVACNVCRHELVLLVRVLDDNVSAEELAIIDSVETNVSGAGRTVVQPLNVYERFFQWLMPVWKPAAICASILIIVAATLVFRNDFSTALRVPGTERTFEARLSGQPYSEFVRTRTGPAADQTISGNDELKRLGANHAEAGRFYLEHDELSKAIAQLEDAEKEKPDSAEICNDLGVAYMESAGDRSLEKALGEFQRALQLHPDYEPAVFNLALAYERLGRFPQAEQELKLYLQIDSDSDWSKEVKSKLQLWKH